jgi:hypothetical protein
MKKLVVALLILCSWHLARSQQKVALTASGATCGNGVSANCLSLSVDQTQGGATFTVTANAGNTIQIEASGDGGASWVAFNVTPSNSTTAVSSTTGTGTWQGNTAGYTNIRMRMSALVSGSTTVSIIQSTASARAGGSSGSSSGIAGTIATGQQAFGLSANTITGDAQTLYVSSFSGADLGAQINTCFTALTANGRCVVSDFSGTQTLSTAVTIPANATLYIPSQIAITQTAAITLSNSNSAVLCPSDRSAVFTKGGNIDQFVLNAALTSVENCALLGVSGSFTGNGINVTTTQNNVVVRGNTISNEATSGIIGNVALVEKNVVTGAATSTSPAISVSGGKALNNIVIGEDGDGIAAIGNSSLVQGNTVSINPATTSVTGLCAIDVVGDVLQSIVSSNGTVVNGTAAGNVNYGVCLTVGVGSNHMYQNTVEHNGFNGVVSGGASAIGYYFNNTQALATEASENMWRDNACTHETTCLLRTDSTNQTNYYAEFVINNGGFSGGSTKDVVVEMGQPLQLATIQAIVSGNGSMFNCSNCGAGRSPQTGSSNILFNAGGQLFGQSSASWTFVPSSGAGKQVGASTTTQAYGANVIAGGFLVVGVSCSAPSAPTFAVSDNLNGTYTSANAVQANPAGSVFQQIWFFPGAAGGTTTVTVSSGGSCTLLQVVQAAYIGIGQISPKDGAGATTNGTGTALASGAFAVTQGDLVVGFGTCNATGISVGAGFVSRGTASTESMLEDQTGLSTASANATFTCATGGWTSQGVAFRITP